MGWLWVFLLLLLDFVCNKQEKDLYMHMSNPKSPNTLGSRRCRFLFLLTEEFFLAKRCFDSYFLLALRLELGILFLDAQAFLADCTM